MTESTTFIVHINTNVDINPATIERAVRNLICDSGYDCSYLSVKVEPAKESYDKDLGDRCPTGNFKRD